MADILGSEVFSFYGIPSVIVSDGGPQFAHQVRKGFCRDIGTILSLTS